MGIGIRPARVADADGLGEVHVRSWQWAYDGVLDADGLAALSVADRASRWRTGLADPDRTVATFVADDGDRVVGFVSVGPGREDVGGPEVGELWAIYLLPEVAGLGLGRRLHDTGLEWLRARGYGRALLWVITGNARGRAFYERQGWRPDGLTRVEDRPGWFAADETRYVLDL